MKLNYESPFVRVLYVTIELLCILGFFVAGLRCLQAAYADYNSGKIFGFLWLVVGGITLMAIAIGGTIQFLKTARRNNQ